MFIFFSLLTLFQGRFVLRPYSHTVVMQWEYNYWQFWKPQLQHCLKCSQTGPEEQQISEHLKRWSLIDKRKPFLLSLECYNSLLINFLGGESLIVTN